MKFRVELAICWPDRSWSTETVELEEDDFLNLGDEGPTEGEIWEAAKDKYEKDHMGGHDAVGLYGWEKLEDDVYNEDDVYDEDQMYCDNCDRPLEEGRIGLCDECMEGQANACV